MKVKERLIGGPVPEQLSSAEVIELLGCTEHQLLLWRRAGLPVRGGRGHQHWYARADLEAFLDARTEP